MMNKKNIIKNWINGRHTNSLISKRIAKLNPHNGVLLSHVIESSLSDVNDAVTAASNAFSSWSKLTPVARGSYLFKVAALMERHKSQLAKSIALETGKPPEDAIGEVMGSIAQCEFFAGEGRRLYSRSLTSGVPNKQSFTIRCPHGVVGLIVPANTPIANIAWKIFPALICGNAIVLKAAEDSPSVANIMANLLKKAGIPKGVFNVIHGRAEAGKYLVNHPQIKLISFTGSTAAGIQISKAASETLKRVSLELGGKNPIVICSDADLEQAVNWTALSAFSNAGQRCAAASKALVSNDIYDNFLEALFLKMKTLKLGIKAGCDLGPVINKKQFNAIKSNIKLSKKLGGKIYSFGDMSLTNPKGFYIQPTVITDLDYSSPINQLELFGPVITITRFSHFEDAIRMANDNEYGLTSAIHTKNIDHALAFSRAMRAGVVNVNAGTYGSEPHMPFGGFGLSGNGTREPGVEALDVYSELKNISFLIRE